MSEATEADPIISGSQALLATVVKDVLDVPTDAEGPLTLFVVEPDGTEKEYVTEELEHPSVGHYTRRVVCVPDGIWNYRWVYQGRVAQEGRFPVASSFQGVTPGSPDLTDLWVLLPQTRRAMEGPYGPPTGKPTLSDEQVYNMIADATADVILFSGSLFGHELEVKKRDPLRGFPTEWATDSVLTVWEGAVIVNQAALDYYFHLFRDLRTSETIQNEGTQWTYELSAGVIKNYLETLKENRDKALTSLRLHHPVLDRYASNIRVRDQATVAVLEWWDTVSPGLTGGGMPGGQEASSIPWFPGEFANP